jgi:electron transport complex protein RnfB
MNDNIYEQLRERIDSYSVGFSATPSGIEINILQKIFTPVEAELYLHMERKLETAEAIARRAGQDKEIVRNILVEMTEKGLTFPRTKAGIKYYAAAPFMHGFFEHHAVKGMDKELAKMYEDYKWGGFIPKTRALRTVPINISLDSHKPVMPYDDVKKIIEGKERIGLFPCACAATMKVLESGCDNPLDVCIAFDYYAEYAIEEFGTGKWITREEALDVLKRSEEAGLVHQVGGDSRNVECICNCCSDCCGALRFFKLLPNPAKFGGSNYFSRLDADLCNYCEICIDRCPMDAITSGSSNVVTNPERCIGCGLCTTTCPTEAITLEMKPENKIKPPPSPDRYTFMRSSLDYDKDVE